MNKLTQMIKNRTFPYVTTGLIMLNVVYFIILVFNGSPNNTRFMLEMGADYAPYVFQRHEFWRLLTSMFMHFSFTHLAGNMIYLGILGFSFEKTIGHIKFLLIYMLSGIGAGVVSCAYYQITGEPVVSAGASGAVYGLIALVVYITYIAAKRAKSAQLFSRIAIMLVFMFYSSFGTGKVDMAAHIGGLIFGLLLCILFLPVKKKKSK